LVQGQGCVQFTIRQNVLSYGNNSFEKDEYGIIKFDILKKCMSDIFEALNHLKKTKMVHRDIKEENFLVDKGKSYIDRFWRSNGFSENGYFASYGSSVWGGHIFIPPEIIKAIQELDRNRTTEYRIN